ncbi:hypothetical protein THAOC_14930, partial [Thalassiosira oceanica]
TAKSRASAATSTKCWPSSALDWQGWPKMLGGVGMGETFS